MRLGLLTAGTVAQLDWIQRLGLRSIEWMRFSEHPACGQTDWKRYADELRDQTDRRGLRISALGALYRNPLDPAQTTSARRVFERAIAVASHLGIKTVAGFPGAIIVTDLNERGGNPVYRPFEEFLPELLRFWEPVAERAADAGVRIAFEHCPQGPFHLPIMGYNMLAQPAMWERLFNATRCDNLGLEWDPSHLICQWIDPVENIRRFGSKIFHVHAKDAFINRHLLSLYGLCHPGVAEHRFPGLGQAPWSQIVHALLRAGYDSDLNIEGWHDPVYRDHPSDSGGKLAGRLLEERGVLIAKQTLERFLPQTD